MLTMIGKRLMFAIPSLIGVMIVTFLLTRALPGDPAAYFAGPAATKEAVEQIRKKLRLDKPLIEQFFRYTNDLAHGDFGNSLTTGQPVAAEIRNRLPPPRADAARPHRFGHDRYSARRARGDPAGIWIDHLCRVTTTAGVRCRCSSPASCWSMYSISGSAGRRRRSAGSMCSTARRRP